MQAWAEQEVRSVQLGDTRLKRRLIHLLEDLTARPAASVPEACGDWADTKGAYRFWDSPRVEAEAIRKAHQESTVERLVAHSTVLVAQDTTELDFTHHPATQGLGPLDRPWHQGLKVHSALTVSAQGVPLGIIHQEVWARDRETIGKRHQRYQLETKDKESQRWLTAVQASQESIPEGIQVITVADREADIYDLFATPRRAGVHLLIRATHNRLVDDAARYLWAAIKQSPVQGQVTIELRRKDNQPPRQATLTVRYAGLAIQPPRNRKGRAALQSIPLQVVLAREENAPPQVTPVCWLLLTTLPCSSFAEAIQCVQWYSYRWLVERYHFVLKSGCYLEELQLEKAERIQRALATYSIVAWRLLWLTYEARENPDAPCDTVLEAHEWQALYCMTHKTSILPGTPPTLHEAVRWIAKLGGFLGRKSDGEPGVKTIWRGLRRLDDMAATWQSLHANLPPVDT